MGAGPRIGLRGSSHCRRINRRYEHRLPWREGPSHGGSSRPDLICGGSDRRGVSNSGAPVVEGGASCDDADRREPCHPGAPAVKGGCKRRIERYSSGCTVRCPG